jgi:hypothetical protein
MARTTVETDIRAAALPAPQFPTSHKSRPPRVDTEWQKDLGGLFVRTTAMPDDGLLLHALRPTIHVSRERRRLGRQGYGFHVNGIWGRRSLIGIGDNHPPFVQIRAGLEAARPPADAPSPCTHATVQIVTYRGVRPDRRKAT